MMRVQSYSDGSTYLASIIISLFNIPRPMNMFSIGISSVLHQNYTTISYQLLSIKYMRLYKLADLFEKKLSLATNQAYEHSAKINSKIADLAGADISEPAVRKLVDNLAHSARFLADKAWRSGVSAEELRSKVEALKSKTNLLAMTLSAQQLPGGEPQASESMSLLGTQ